MSQNNINLGKNQTKNDFSQAQLGESKEAFAKDPKTLEIFNAADLNKNGKLDSLFEVSLFNQKTSPQPQGNLEIPFFNRNGCDFKNEQAVFIKQAAAQEEVERKETEQRKVHTRRIQQSTVQTQKEAEGVAGQLCKIAASNVGAVSRPDFQANLGKVSSYNVVEVVQEFDKISPDESILEMICDEKGNSNTTRKSAVLTVYNALLARGEKAGINKNHLNNFRIEFTRAVNYEFKKIGFTDTKNMDELMYGLIQSIQNVETIPAEQKADIRAQDSKTHQQDAINFLTNKASTAENAFQNQKNYDGWIGKMVDGIAANVGSSNTSKVVQKDIDLYKSQTKSLEEAKLQGNRQFNDKFYQIYGVDFDPVQMAVYKKQEEKYNTAVVFHVIENQFNSEMKKLMASPALRQEEKSTMTSDGILLTTVLASADEVYHREVEKFAQFLGQGDYLRGINQINEELVNQGIDPSKASKEQKYKSISKMAKTYSEKLNSHTQKATDGKGFEQVKKEFDHSYTATFGNKNNLTRRVDEYNTSQQTGTLIAKGAITIVGATVIGTVTGGAGIIPMLSAAAGTTAFSAGIGLSDRMTSNNGLSAEEAKNIVAEALIDGGTMIASGGAAMVAKTASLGKTASFAIRTTVDTSANMGAEYLKTGKVTWANTLISAAASSSGQIVENLIEAKKVASAQKTSSQNGVIPETQQNVPSPKDYNVDGNTEIIARTPSEDTNRWWAASGYDNPPYLPNSEVEHICLKKETTFVRVYDGETSSMYGGWVMKKEDLVGLSPMQIKDKFALPCMPKYVADVTLDSGTVLRKGLCNPLDGWGKGGGTQFDLQALRKGKFDNPRLLSEFL